MIDIPEPSAWIAVFISFIALVISAAHVYYNLFWNSENTGIILLDYTPVSHPEPGESLPLPGESKALKMQMIGLRFKIAFVNSGNRDVLVSDVRLELETKGCATHSSYPSQKVEVDERAEPILLPPKSARIASHRFSTGNPCQSLAGKAVVSVIIEISTIGPTGSLKKTQVQAGEIRFVEGRESGFSVRAPKLQKVR